MSSCSWRASCSFCSLREPVVPGELVVPAQPSILARALESLERARNRYSSECGDSAGKPRPFPKNPVRAVERTTRAARGTSSRTTPEGLGGAVTREGLDAKGSRDFHLFWVLCKCVCVAPVLQVELFKCSCVIIIFGSSSALCPCFCFFASTVYVHENCC